MKFEKSHLAAVALAATMLSPLQAPAATGQDATFVHDFSASGADEIALANLAIAKSHNGSVVAFARKMTSDHGQAGAKLNVIAHPLGDSPTMTPDAAGRAMSTKLMHATSFDATYRMDNIAGHQKAIAILQQEIASGKNAQLVAFAKSTLPTVRQHLSLAEMLPQT